MKRYTALCGDRGEHFAGMTLVDAVTVGQQSGRGAAHDLWVCGGSLTLRT
jgi:hypothetical protein